jgi:hypothetical protein
MAIQPIFQVLVEIVKSILPLMVDLIKGLMPIIRPIFMIFQGIAEMIGGIINGDWNKVGEGLKKVGIGILNLVIGLIEGVINLLIFAANSIIYGITFGAVKNAIGNITLPKIALAEGGIVNSPMNALIGEKGPEAVVPLNNDKSMNVNTKALEDKLERLITAVEKGGVVNIDGQKVAIIMSNLLALTSYKTQ